MDRRLQLHDARPPRHGTVLPIMQAEYDRLLQQWG
ncbi:glycoside hydrolase family 43 protein [Micromonospora sp. KC606]|nr:glycoside hydrolase family 43 protein [Micromonospora sp. KC606]